MYCSPAGTQRIVAPSINLLCLLLCDVYYGYKKREETHFMSSGDIMMKKILYILIIVSVVGASSGLRFYMDTTITCGLKEVPVVVRASFESVGDPISEIGDTLYTDSLGRVVKRDYICNTIATGSSNEIHATSFLGNSDDIIIRYTTIKNNSSVSSSVTEDTLIGEIWNEQGEIVEGRIYRVKEYTSGVSGQKRYADTFLVRIEFDSTGVVPIDTLSLDSSGFVPDTMITAGALEIPVRHYYAEEVSTTPGISEGCNLFRDSSGRWLLGEMTYKNSKISHEREEYRKLLLDSSGSVVLRYTNLRNVSRNQVYKQVDTLEGLSWNSMGMVTKGHVRCSINSITHGNKSVYHSSFDILYGYDSTKLLLLDSFQVGDSGFQPDTLIDLQIPYDFYPVTYEKSYVLDTIDVAEGNVIIRDEKIFRDSLLRSIKTVLVENGKNWGKTTRSWVSFNQYDRVDTSFYTRGYGSVGGSSSQKDTLIGKGWNEMGLITKGELRRRYTSSHSGKSTVKDSAFAVEILYDSSLLHPVDTIFSNLTSIVVNRTDTSNSFSLSICGHYLSIQGLQAKEVVTLFDVKGRLLFQGRTNQLGGIAIPRSHFAAGVALLQTGFRVYPIRL